MTTTAARPECVAIPILLVAALMWVLGFLKLPDVGEPSSAPLDFASIPLSALAFGPLIYGLSLIGADDVAFWVPMLSIGVGLGALLAFVARQLVLQGRNEAFLDLRTFTHGVFIVAVAMLALTKMALMGTIVLIPLILQRAFGMDALHVGLILLPEQLLEGSHWAFLGAGAVWTGAVIAASFIRRADSQD